MDAGDSDHYGPFFCTHNHDVDSGICRRSEVMHALRESTPCSCDAETDNSYFYPNGETQTLPLAPCAWILGSAG